MPSVLVCARHKESQALLKSFLILHKFCDLTYADDGEQALCLCLHRHFTLVLVDLPFIENGHELSFLIKLYGTAKAFMIAIIGQRKYEDLREPMENVGIFTMCKPIHREAFAQLLSFIHIAQYHYGSMLKQQQQLVDQIKAIKLIDRAKCLLIENEYVTEAEAHKQIEKAAMNERVTRAEIAQRIIAEYEEGR